MNTKLQWSHRRRTTNIFGFLNFETITKETKETSNKAKCFWIFEMQLRLKISKLKLETNNETSKQRETTEIFLIFLCFEKQHQSKKLQKE